MFSAGKPVTQRAEITHSFPPPFSRTARKWAIVATCAGALAGILSPTASAGVIFVGGGNTVIIINQFNAHGQSFTAEDPFISAGFLYYFMNDRINLPLTFSLFEGFGVAGARLSSQQVVLDGSRRVFAVDFTSVELSVGSVYSLFVEDPNNTERWGVTYGGLSSPDSIPYSGGQAFSINTTNGQLTTDASRDLGFIVAPGSFVEFEVSAPPTLPLLLTALAAAGFLRRRRA